MKNILYPIICALILASILLFLFQSVKVLDNDTHQRNIEVKPVLKRFVQSEQIAIKIVDSLREQNSIQSTQLIALKTELAKVKKKNSSLKSSVEKLLDRSENAFAQSEVHRYAYCDSVIEGSKELLQSVATKDSLYELVIKNLEIQLVNKDSIIEINDKLYAELKTSFKQSIDQQQVLLIENKHLQKQIKRQERKGKFQKATLFVLTGIITYKTVRP